MFNLKALIKEHTGLDFNEPEIKSDAQSSITAALFSLDDETWSKLPFELQCFAHDVNACLENNEDIIVDITAYEPQLVLELSDIDSLDSKSGYVFEVSFKTDPPTDPVQGLFVEASASKGFLVLDVEGRQLELKAPTIDEIVLISKEVVEAPKPEPEVVPEKKAPVEKKEAVKKAPAAPKSAASEVIKPPRKSALSELKIFMLKKGLGVTKEEVRNHLQKSELKMSDSTFEMCFNDMRSTLKIIEWLAKGDI